MLAGILACCLSGGADLPIQKEIASTAVKSLLAALVVSLVTLALAALRPAAKTDDTPMWV